MKETTEVCPNCGAPENSQLGWRCDDFIVPGRFWHAEWTCMKCGEQRMDMDQACPPRKGEPITFSVDALRALVANESQVVKIYLTMLALSNVQIGEKFSVRAREIAETAGITISSLYRQFPIMEERGLLTIESHGQGRTLNTYRLGNVLQ